MSQERNFTEGKILSPLIRFMVPVFLAILCLIWFRRTNRKYSEKESGALSGLLQKK